MEQTGPSPPNNYEFVARHPIYSNEHLWSHIDEFRRGEEQFLLGHIRFSKFSPSILKGLLAEWGRFRSVVTAPIFVFGEQDDDKWARFVALLGFKELPNCQIVWDGTPRRWFIHFKDFHARSQL